MTKYKNWTPWDPLKTVMLGDCYPPNFYDDVVNPKIRGALQRITNETIEDLDYYKKVLKDFGCTVLRPKIDRSDSIMNYINQYGGVSGKQGVPRSPLQPRDAQLVIGEKLYYTINDHYGIKEVLSEYDSDYVDISKVEDVEGRKGCKLTREHFEALAGVDWMTFDDYLKPDFFDKVMPHIAEEIISHHGTSRLPAPCVTVVGKDLYVDTADDIFFPFQEQALRRLNPDMRINKLSIGGHNDGCFHVMKPGALISIKEIEDYSESFPNWDVLYLPNTGWGQVKGFMQMKSKVNGKWWVPGEEENDEFTAFVETWLNEWVGYAEESVFDVNVLCLDDKHVCVNNYNEEAFAYFKKIGMEPIIVPFRHRYFWDGGLHCITLDLYREGEMIDVFPTRSAAIEVRR